MGHRCSKHVGPGGAGRGTPSQTGIRVLLRHAVSTVKIGALSTCPQIIDRKSDPPFDGLMPFDTHHESVRDHLGGHYRFSSTCLLLVLATVLAGPAFGAPDTVVLDPETALINIDGHTEVLVDPSRVLTIDAIRAHSGFRSTGPGAYSKPLDQVVVWLRFEVRNDATQMQRRYLEIDSPIIDEIDVYLAFESGAVTHFAVGESVPMDARPVPYLLPRIPVQIAPGESVEIYLRFLDFGALVAPLTMGDPMALSLRTERRQYWRGVTLGMMLLVLVYALVTFLRLRFAPFGWLASFIFFMTCVNGFFVWGDFGAYLPDPERAFWVARLIIATASLTLFSLLRFILSLLDLQRFFPTWSRILRLANWGFVLSSLTCFLLPFTVSIYVFSALLALTLPIALGLLCRRALSKDRLAILMVIAVTVLAAGATLILLRVAAILPISRATEQVTTLGTLLLMVFVSEAIVLRVRMVERARRKAIEDKLEQAQRAATISDAFGRYVSADLAEELLRNPEALKPGGALRTVTVLMSDLRGFTSLTERLGPQGMVTLLNKYLETMTDVIEEHGGYINEFIGDAILVIFGVPSPREDDPRRAIRCAIEMQRALHRFNQQTDREVPLQMGIGIHTGRVVIGNIGSEKRISYGVIGEAVNLTARIESLTVGSEILVSDVTHTFAEGQIQFDTAREARVKGHSEPLVVHPILGDEIGPLVIDTAQTRAVSWRAKVSAIVGKVVSEDTTILTEVEIRGDRGPRSERAKQGGPV